MKDDHINGHRRWRGGIRRLGGACCAAGVSVMAGGFLAYGYLIVADWPVSRLENRSTSLSKRARIFSGVDFIEQLQDTLDIEKAMNQKYGDRQKTRCGRAMWDRNDDEPKSRQAENSASREQSVY